MEVEEQEQRSVDLPPRRVADRSVSPTAVKRPSERRAPPAWCRKSGRRAARPGEIAGAPRVPAEASERAAAAVEQVEDGLTRTEVGERSGVPREPGHPSRRVYCPGTDEGPRSPAVAPALGARVRGTARGRARPRPRVRERAGPAARAARPPQRPRPARGHAARGRSAAGGWPREHDHPLLGRAAPARDARRAVAVSRARRCARSSRRACSQPGRRAASSRSRATHRLRRTRSSSAGRPIAGICRRGPRRSGSRSTPTGGRDRALGLPSAPSGVRARSDPRRARRTRGW